MIKAFSAVAVFAAFLLFFGLGERSLRNPDEGRYAEIGREMAVSGRWVEPKIYGVDYLRKPPLFYWLVAASYKFFGFSEGSARAVPALFGFLGVLATFFFTKKFLGQKTAIYAALLLISNVWYLQIGRYLIIDMVFSFFMVSALYLFYLAVNEGRHKRIYCALFYALVSLSVLAKGIIGLALVGLPAVFYLLWKKEFRKNLGEMNLPLGAVIFGLIVTPWFIKMESLQPGFLKTFIFHEHLMRLVSKNYEHQEPWYYYFLLFPVLLMPWIFFGETVKTAFLRTHDRRQNDVKIFLGLSMVSILGVYSTSNSKLLTYMLPAIFFACVLLADGWTRWEEAAGDATFSKIMLIFMGFVSATALIAIPRVPVFISSLSEDLRASLFYFEWIGGFLLAASLAGRLLLAKKRTDLLFAAFVIAMAGISFMVSGAMRSLNDNYSTKRFAEDLRPKIRSGDEVFIYGSPGAFYDFGFYLRRPVRLVGLEGELELSRKETQDKNSWVDPGEFEKMLGTEKNLYCLIRRSDFFGFSEMIRNNLEIIAQNDRKVLFATRHSEEPFDGTQGKLRDEESQKRDPSSAFGGLRMTAGAS